MARIAVLGAGMVGSGIAGTLSKTHEILLVDLDRNKLQAVQSKTIKTLTCDLTDSNKLSAAISDVNLVIGAAPGHVGYEVLKNVIHSGKNMVDISFFPEDASTLNALAKKNHVVVIHDCGVAPGMDNIILGYHDTLMKVNSFKCMVGGLPVKKNPPFDYKAPFSPIDVLEEYTRPARLKIKGKIIIKPALTDIETIAVNQLGKLEAFNSDGLRSLLKTMKNIPEMIEKTIRYPGHAKQMEWVRETGLLDKTPVEIKGISLRPLDMTSKLLFSRWAYNPAEEDFTYMVLEITGIENRKKVKYTYTLLDHYDKKNKMSSMARTTGMTACAAAELILNGSFNKFGIHPPEHLGASSHWVIQIFQYLKNHGIIYKMKRQEISRKL